MRIILIKYVWVLQIVLRSADVLKQIESAFTMARLGTLWLGFL